MSAAFFATSVPVMPMAKPTSALFKAGASFVPSPVTATIDPSFFKAVTNKYLSSGDERAKIFSLFCNCLNALLFPTVSLPYAVVR